MTAHRAPSARLVVHERAVERCCPYCKGELARDRLWTCSGCRTTHHAECARAHRRCALFGCGVSSITRTWVAPRPESGGSGCVTVAIVFSGLAAGATTLLSFPFLYVIPGHPDFQAFSMLALVVGWLAFVGASAVVTRRQLLLGGVVLFLFGVGSCWFCWQGTRSQLHDGRGRRAIDDHVTRRIQ